VDTSKRALESMGIFECFWRSRSNYNGACLMSGLTAAREQE